MKIRSIFSTRFLLFLVGIGSFTFLTLVFVFATFPYQSNQPSPKHLIVENGDGLNLIAAKLENQGIVRSRQFFKWFSIAMGNLTNYKHGEYLIEGDVSVLDLVKLLEEGRTILIPVTFPEGLRMREMFSVLKDKGYENAQQYNTLSKSKPFIQSLGYPIPNKTLEGFLFPETYKFSKTSTEKTILRKMVDTFFHKLPNNYEQLAKNVGLSFYEAIILASIIEKETSVPSERALIASVFHNRLKKNMRLQTDPTVIYGIKNFDGNLTRRQLRTRTPYNTYTNYGLPPTPIANPGLQSLMAAVKPAKSNYIYFVAKGDGTHVFSVNYQQHKRAVAKFQKRRKRNYRSY